MTSSYNPVAPAKRPQNPSAHTLGEALSNSASTLPSRGRRLPLSPGRQLVGDLLYFSRRVPSQAIARDCHFPHLGTLRKKKRRDGQTIGWATLFIRAYAILSARRPDLRQCFMPWPWAHVYEHPYPVCRITVSRRHGNEDCVFFAGIERPELMTLAELQAAIEHRKYDPIETVRHFRNQVAFAKVPTLIRRIGWWFTLNVSGSARAYRLGTFGMTSVAAAGAFSLHPPSTGTTTLTYGPIDAEGNARVTMVYDHRLLDGMTVAKLLRELEEILNEEVAEELSRLRSEETETDRLRLPR